ncbi:class II aldolase/adducin family protein [Aureimonas flava]|uniref:Class II aldolase/adducin family protein n=1 Tax=Aureimonas flava TaxID=2320271 RepID=A0A3A1WF65_9HYPH|nr:class II aldolase/adducin family protein [Aureimonas flava]RIX98218.1 class II aldolase/adducin family protein [Aureimonas flava]
MQAPLDPRQELVLANRILAREDVLDVFGHVSVRSPDDPGRFLLSRAVSPETVTLGDILEFTLDSNPVDAEAPPSYSERVIHGELYRARPDVAAVCHFHASSIMPFCITGQPLVPVSHVGATMGPVRRWSAQETFGDTNLLVATSEEGASLARAMGSDWAVMMAHHGGVVAGRSLREAVFRTVQLCRNAETQLTAMRIGTLQELTPREIELSGEFNLRPPILERAWNHWVRRLGGAGSAERAMPSAAE